MPWVLPLIHPSAIVRGQWPEEPAQVAYLKQAADFLKGWRPPNVEEPPPDSWLWPTLDTLRRFDEHLTVGSYDGLAVDIENAGQYLTLIGVTAMDLTNETLGASLSLPFRARYGQRYWSSYSDHCCAVNYLGSWLADPNLAKIFHNGVSHDVPILRDHGFDVEGPLWDTMVMAHHCYPEMRKSLSYCSTLYLGLPNWKVLLEDDDEDEGKS